MGIYNTLSFILEGKRYGDLVTKTKRHTLGQLCGLRAFLEPTLPAIAEFWFERKNK